MYLLLQDLRAKQGRGFFRVFVVQLKVAVLCKADQRVGMLPLDFLVLPQLRDRQRFQRLRAVSLRQLVAGFLL